MTSSRAALTLAACSGMFGYGIVMALFGAILPVISTRLSIGLVQAGLLFAVMNAAMLVTSLALGPRLDSAGAAMPLRVAPYLVALGLIVIANAGGFLHLSVGAGLLGVGGAALNQATNTLVAGLHTSAVQKGAALNLLGVFFGVGALFVPFTVGALLNALGITPILYLAAAVTIITSVLSYTLAFPTPAPLPAASARFATLARQPLVITLAALFFFESGNEFILGGYITTVLVSRLGASLPVAAYSLAGYWAALMVMRILLVVILPLVGGARLVAASALGVAAGAALLATAQSTTAGVAATLILGASISAIFPTTLGFAGSHYPAQSGTVFGILIAAGLVGGMILPVLAGQAGQMWDIRAAIGIVVVNALAIFCLQWTAMRIRKS